MLSLILNNYRRSFLKRKFINNYKKNVNGTPTNIDKLINCFERKIKGIEIFNDSTKKLYFEGLNKIYSDYYDEMKFNKISKKELYFIYLSENYKVTGRGKNKHNNRLELMTFEQFKKSGYCNKFKKNKK